MSEPTIEQVAKAVYIIGCNLNGRCVYCGLNLSGALPEVKLEHYRTEHIDE